MTRPILCVAQVFSDGRRGPAVTHAINGSMQQNHDLSKARRGNVAQPG
jgi:hypothetical protein